MSKMLYLFFFSGRKVRRVPAHISCIVGKSCKKQVVGFRRKSAMITGRIYRPKVRWLQPSRGSSFDEHCNVKRTVLPIFFILFFIGWIVMKTCRQNLKRKHNQGNRCVFFPFFFLEKMLFTEDRKKEVRGKQISGLTV